VSERSSHTPGAVRLEPVTDREALVPILLEADESEEVLRTYLNQGELYRLVAEPEEIGAVLLIAGEDRHEVEIKNIALAEAYRGRGLGRAAIEAIAEHAREAGARRLVVGTADTGTGTIAFYRRVGFRDAGRIEGFFDAYPEPVVEGGVVAHDMIRFEMHLDGRAGAPQAFGVDSLRKSDDGEPPRSPPTNAWGSMDRFRLHPGNDGVIYLGGELDLLSADRVESEAFDRADGPHDLVLDLTDVSFIDSTGIRAFLRLAQRLHPRCLVLREPQPHVQHVLEIVRIETFGIRIEHRPSSD
jgi:anti-anti-sigma factor